MSIDSLLSELGDYAGLSQVTLDENRACCLVFNESIHLNLEAHPDDDQTLLLQIVVGQVPAEGQREFYLRLLAANHARCREGIYSIVPESREVVLWRSLLVTDLDVESLATILNDFVQSAESAETDLTQPDPSESELERGSLPIEPSAMIRV